MKRRLVIMTEIISPYRTPLFNALAKEEGIDLHVIFLSETDRSLRQWNVYKAEIQFSYSVLPSWRKRVGKYNALLNRGLARALRAADPDVVLCGGYSYLASWQALRWATSQEIPFLLWSESNSEDRRAGRPVVEYLKHRFIRSCSGFVVPGVSAGKYLESLGVPADKIFPALNAVDNELFSQGAEHVRRDQERYRQELELPKRYFLFVGRLVADKGVFDLLHAYAALGGTVRERVGLVFVGDGVARKKLEDYAREVFPGTVKFAGFVQREQLPAYYSLSEAFVLPTYSDPWGLVVNEAMACGLPIVLSRVAGCAADLVRDGWNGLLVSPGDISALTRCLETMATRSDLVQGMGSNSREHIQRYSPQGWSAGVVRVVENMFAAPVAVVPSTQ